MGSRLLGAALTPAQHWVLARLGIAEAYRALAEPEPFVTVLAARAARRPPLADADYLSLMALLRGPSSANVPSPVAILPTASGQERFALRNRASLRRLGARPPRSPCGSGTEVLRRPPPGSRKRLVLLAEPERAGLLGHN